jgi:hypothetical protein
MSGTVVVARAVQLDGMTRDWMTRAVQRALLWVQPAGGQGRARRNAWSSMVRDTQRRAQRLEVERSIAAASAGAAGAAGMRRTGTA